MTVNTTASKTVALGNGTDVEFDFSFIGVSANYLKVLYTDADGAQTLLDAADYDIVLTAAVTGALWGLGGTVTYPLSGSPIPAGSTLTIYRDLPLLQAIVLQNQASYGQYAQSAEQAIDLLEMQLQQVNETIARALQFNIANENAPDPLPPAAECAGLQAIFSASGESLLAGTALASGYVSAAMQDVIGAATIAAGRTAFGLGTMAVEGIGSGLRDDGVSDSVMVNLPLYADGGNQAVDSTFNLTRRIATGALIYTLAKASTLWNGFGFWVFAKTAAVTLLPNGADNFPSVGSGTAIVIPAGYSAFVSTDAVSSWFAEFSSPYALANSNPPYSFDMPVNLQLNAAVSSNVLTVSLKGNNGNDPSATNPVQVPFRSSDITSGAPSLLTITSALSLSTIVGASLGSSSANIAFRFWIVLFNNGGTPVLGLINCSTSAIIHPLNESLLASSTAMSAAATSAGVFYTPSGTTITSKAFRIIGYLEYESGLTTAGTFASVPTRIQLFGPGIKKPGDPVQQRMATDATQTQASVANTNVASSLTLTVPVSNACNLVRVLANGPLASASNVYAVMSILRGATLIGINGIMRDAGASGFTGSVSFGGLDKPNAAGNATYTANIKPVGASTTVTWLPTAAGGSGIIEAWEIMG